MLTPSALVIRCGPDLVGYERVTSARWTIRHSANTMGQHRRTKRQQITTSAAAAAAAQKTPRPVAHLHNGFSYCSCTDVGWFEGVFFLLRSRIAYYARATSSRCGFSVEFEPDFHWFTPGPFKRSGHLSVLQSDAVVALPGWNRASTRSLPCVQCTQYDPWSVRGYVRDSIKLPKKKPRLSYLLVCGVRLLINDHLPLRDGFRGRKRW